MNVDETREVRRLLQELTWNDNACLRLAMLASQGLGGYPVSAGDIRKAWKKVDSVLAAGGGQGTFIADLGRTAHYTARFKADGMPRDTLDGFMQMASEACEAELPHWLLDKALQHVMAKTASKPEPPILRKAASATTTAAWAPIVKAEKQADGTLLVYGKVSDDSLDGDEQICDATWLKTAIPEWYRTGGNIREQHTTLAAGKAVSYEHKTDGHYITALVVDPTSVAKVEADVLKGFSIGIKRPRVVVDSRAKGGRIVGGRIVEVSLVDRPCNPACSLAIAKSDAAGMAVHIEQQFVDDSGTDHTALEVARLRKMADGSHDPQLRDGFNQRADTLEKVAAVGNARHPTGAPVLAAKRERLAYLRKMADGSSDPQLQSGFTQMAEEIATDIARLIEEITGMTGGMDEMAQRLATLEGNR
jgi:hypothetical protein